MTRTTLAYAPARAARPAGVLGLSGSAVKPGGSVVNLQGLPTMTLTLGTDSPRRRDRARRARREGARGTPEVDGGQGGVREVT